MLYDLNVAWSPSMSIDRLTQTLTVASSMGYATVALNHTLELPLPANPTSPFPKMDTSPSLPAPKLPNILQRATLPLADPAASNYRLPALVSVYDLVAVRPLTEKAFQNACLTLDIPLISLDLTQHHPFHFRPKPCMAAVSRGVRFEICYAQLLGADNRGRSNFISNAMGLFRATRGRGIILSSEAKSALHLRAPADIVNLVSVWGLSKEKGIEGFQSIPRSVVVNEGLKRTGYRGVINIVQIANKNEKEDAIDDRETVDQAGKMASGNQKRKNGEQEGQPLSKRQAKKMKLAARVAGGKS